MNERFAAAIAESRGMPVLREDMLGEGEGAWDSDPRYPTETVNCLIWLQLVICEVYGRGQSLESKIRIMDRIRYYGGHVAYGLRKCHFLEHGLLLEPEPLVTVRLNRFPGYSRRTVRVDKERFRAYHNYPVRLYREELDTFDIDYITAEGLLKAVEDLTPGFYISFGVAGPYYEKLYGQGQGAMGLVHSLIISISDSGDSPRAEQAVVYHASTVLGSVTEVPLTVYVEKMSVLFYGYALFELDPGWDFHTRPEADEEVERILRCEATLPPNEESRKL
jgi:hypothetical protein